MPQENPSLVVEEGSMSCVHTGSDGKQLRCVLAWDGKVAPTVGVGAPVMVIFTGAFAPCVLNAWRGAHLVERHLIEAARTLGAGSLRVLAEVLLPGALPSVVSGLRISAGLGWQSLIGAELIVVSSGIGYVLVQGQSNLAPEIVMAAMLAVGVTGLLIDLALRFAEARLQRRWGQSS